MSDVTFEGSTTIKPPATPSPETTITVRCSLCGTQFPLGGGHLCIPGSAQPIQFHQWLDKEPTMNVKVEKNSKGFNYEATVLGARSPAEAVALLLELTVALGETYGQGA